MKRVLKISKVSKSALELAYEAGFTVGESQSQTFRELERRNKEYAALYKKVEALKEDKKKLSTLLAIESTVNSIELLPTNEGKKELYNIGHSDGKRVGRNEREQELRKCRYTINSLQERLGDHYGKNQDK